MATYHILPGCYLVNQSQQLKETKSNVWDLFNVNNEGTTNDVCHCSGIFLDNYEQNSHIVLVRGTGFEFWQRKALTRFTFMEITLTA